jgi:hypothetical protein
MYKFQTEDGLSHMPLRVKNKDLKVNISTVCNLNFDLNIYNIMVDDEETLTDNCDKCFPPDNP